MKSAIIQMAVLMVVIIATSICAQPTTMEETEIVNVIQKAYVGGAFNDKDTKAMLEGFHSSFLVQAVHEGEFRVTALKDWMSEINGWKSGRVENDEHVRDWSQIAKAKINVLSVKGTGAVAQVDLTLNEELSFSTFFSLIKFQDGWKIVNQIYGNEADE